MQPERERRPLRAARIPAAAMAWAALALVPVAAAAPPLPAETSLAVLRRTFAAFDADGDKRIAAAEATAGGLDAACFVTHDRDHDGYLDADEFTMCYRALLVKAGRTVPADIAEEVARVRARIRAREEAKRRRNE